MTPVFCQTKHNPNAGIYGDCARACIATLLDMSSESVPHFYYDNDPSAGMVRISEFLKSLNLVPFYTHYSPTLSLETVLEITGAQNPDVPYMLFASTDGVDHVVVCRGGKIVHNPSWLATALDGPPSHGYWTLMVIARA